MAIKKFPDEADRLFGEFLISACCFKVAEFQIKTNHLILLNEKGFLFLYEFFR